MVALRVLPADAGCACDVAGCDAPGTSFAAVSFGEAMLCDVHGLALFEAEVAALAGSRVAESRRSDPLTNTPEV